MRLLIVDDDAKNRKLLSKVVAEFGECETAEGGQEAISAFKNAWDAWRPFNIIFLDIMMPEMDGREVLHQIRHLEKEKKVAEQHQVKIIMVSGMSEKETVIKCLQEGCDEFIVKPIEIKLVIEKMQHLGVTKPN